MAKKSQPSESEINNNSELNQGILNDPMTEGLKDNKQYGHFNANIITDKPNGEIPDIPEMPTSSIDVDFTSDNSSSSASANTHQVKSDPDNFMSDPEDLTGKTDSDISEENKSELAGVVGEIMFTGLDLMNDFIVKKLVVNEEKLKQLAMSGEIPFEIISVKVEFSPTFIFDMTEFLTEQETKTRKALEFKNSEKKHINELLQEALKSKKFKMTPEGAIFASIVTHYAAAGYQLLMNNQEVMKMIQLVAERFDYEREHAQHIRSNAGRRPKAETKKQPAPQPPEDENLSGKSTPETPIMPEFREPGETIPSSVTPPSSGKTRNAKRRFTNVEEAQLT